VKDGIGREMAGNGHVNRRVLLHTANLRHGKEGMLWIFFARKIRRLRPGSNPRSWVPEASMLTTRPPKTLIIAVSLCGYKIRPLIHKVKNEGLRFCVCVVIQFAAAPFSCYKHALFLELGQIHS
jgi:hypothetical protein